MEHWFDRATKFFAGGTISRRGVLEGAALAGTSALIAGSPALAWGESELAQHRRRRRIPGNRGAGGPCTRQDKGGTSTMTFSAHGTYKGQALTLQGTHTTRNHKHPSGKTHMRVDLAGNLLLDITHSSTQSGTSKGRGSPLLQGTVAYGSAVKGVRQVNAVSRNGSNQGFVDGRAFTASGATAGRFKDGKPAPTVHMDPALAQAVKALFARAAVAAAHCGGASRAHASAHEAGVATRADLLSRPLRELTRSASSSRDLAQTFGGGPCADCYNSCDDHMVECQAKAFASCASGPFCLIAIGECVNSWNNCSNACFKTGGPCCSVKCHPSNVGEATCCASGEKCCGDACCGGDTPVCMYPNVEAANYGFCCPAGTYGCKTLEHAGDQWYDTCCAKGTACCGSICCSADQYCASSIGLVCCTKGQSYCAGQCCSGKCLKDGAGNEFCCTPGSICGSTCCSGDFKCLKNAKGNHICCNGTLCGDQCCGPGAICYKGGRCLYGKPCGSGVCGLTNPICCNGTCCASNQNCVKGVCTGPQCQPVLVPCQYSPGMCCPPNTTCCPATKQCCTSGQMCCGSLGCTAPGNCIQ